MVDMYVATTKTSTAATLVTALFEDYMGWVKKKNVMQNDYRKDCARVSDQAVRSAVSSES